MKREVVLERYKDKSEKIQEYMSMLTNALEEKYTTIPESFVVSLDLLVFNLEVLFDSMKEMKEKGMTETDKYRGEKKSTGLQSFFNAQNYITKILAQFGFNPMSASKIKQNKEELNLQKYIESMTE